MIPEYPELIIPGFEQREAEFSSIGVFSHEFSGNIIATDVK